MQIASMVTEEGGEARTINLCKRCYNERLVHQGKQPLLVEGMERDCRKKRLVVAGYGKFLEVNNFLRGMWEHFDSHESVRARKMLADAAQVKQEGTQGEWQQESPFKEVLEQVKRHADTNCNAQIMRRAYSAKKSGNWESFKEECKKEGKICEWTL